MNRRQFFTLGAGAAAATALPKPASALPKPPLMQLPGNPWAPEKLPTPFSRSALIVGGGLAGLSAALELAERGYAVTVREAGSVLGGRLATPRIKTAAGEFNVEHGLHMWFDNYHNFRDIRSRLGIDKYFRPYDEVFTIYRDYEPEILQSKPPIYPLNLLSLLQRSKNVNMFSAFEQFKMVPQVMFYNHDRVYEELDHLTFEEWAQGRVSKSFYDLYMQPASSVTLNDPSKVSAAEMVAFMHYYFIGQPKAMNREITTVDHATGVLNPWRDRLLSLGVKIELGRAVPGLRFQDGRAMGEIGTNEEFDHVILALDVGGAQAVLRNSDAYDGRSADALGALRGRVDSMKIAPPYKVMRLWFDRQPDASRPDLIETPQHHPINLIAQFDKLEDESAQWAKQTGGSIFELHLYADWRWADMPDALVWPEVKDTFLEVLPEMANANIIDYTVGSYHNFTSIEAGQGTLRPKADFPRTVGLENVALAGDWVKTDYPSALMERAVSTGREAANLALYADDVRAAVVVETSKHGPGLV
ncbi:MAG: FAD-dependent oxidoreductase [Myxococcota bacterium]|nr:FAD-dependent oxidoreductase [Myxococcota bacterium]